MLGRLRRFLDVRAGEGLPVLLSFLYVAAVVAAFLLAKPIRNSLYLREYGPYKLVYAYAAVPLALSLFIPIYGRLAARVGSRTATTGTLVFFSLNVLAFWWAFRTYKIDLLPGIFYVWVNCFGVIAPVQAWSFANSLFDARQARRLFGLIGAGASLGAIGGGVMARYLVEPVGGTVNMMLVLAALIMVAAGIVGAASPRIKRRSFSKGRSRSPESLRDVIKTVLAKPYLRLMAALVILVAIVTQWTAFQLSLVADARFADDADAMTRFFGTFNFVLGAVGLLLQVLLTGTLLRTVGVASVILLLPIALTVGSGLTVLFPYFIAVLVTNATDQSLRFSIDKAAYELLYLPIPPGERQGVKAALDLIANRVGDAAGGILLGLATGGFLMLPGAGFMIRGTAAMTFGLSLVWIVVVWRLRRAYVGAIGETIHRYRIDTEQTLVHTAQSMGEVLAGKLKSSHVEDVRFALESLLNMRTPQSYPELHALLTHEKADIRRDALAVLTRAGDRRARLVVEGLLRDRDLEVRTQALLYLARDGGFDPLQRIQELGAFDDFSIRAGLVAFLAAKGPSRNEEAARLILEQMVDSDDVRDRAEAARLLAMIKDLPVELLERLINDLDQGVARAGCRAAERVRNVRLFDCLLLALARNEIAEDAATALAALGDEAVPLLEAGLVDPEVPLEARREVPAVLVRIGTFAAHRALLSGLLDADAPLRHRVISSLNKLKERLPDLEIDSTTIELLLAAEIAGHYRSYQLLAQLGTSGHVVAALRVAMEQELERIFRLIGLLARRAAVVHDAYVGVRSTDSLVRANALEYLENVLKPELREVLLPLIDPQVSEAGRAAIGERLIGTTVETREEAIATLLASPDPWLRSRAEIAANRVAEEGPEHTPAPAALDAAVGAG